MAESMQGLEENPPLRRVVCGKCGTDSNDHGMGAEEQKQGRTCVCRCERPFRYHTGCM